MAAWSRITTEQFYAERPILQAMRSVHDGIWSDDSGPARSVLFRHLLLGTETQSAVAALSKESFGCSEMRDRQGSTERALQKRAQELREKLQGDVVQTKDLLTKDLQAKDLQAKDLQ